MPGNPARKSPLSNYFACDTAPRTKRRLDHQGNFRLMKFTLLFFLIAASYFFPLESSTISRNTPKSPASIQFVDITARAGIKWNLKALAPGARYLIETMGGGGGFIDYNGDGLLDIYLVCYSQT